MANQNGGGKHLLDVGAGTGLLSLMVAQKNELVIDAVEIDGMAAAQAAQNFLRSPWHSRLTVLHADVRCLHPERHYDWIISNPPFYEDDLRSANEKVNHARHDTALTIDALLTAIGTLLTPEGFFAVLLPWKRRTRFVERAVAKGFFLDREMAVRHSTRHPNSRSILVFSRQQTRAFFEQVEIRDTGGTYSRAFASLLQEFYLYL